MATERTSIEQKDRWNVEAMFPNIDAWKQAFEKVNPRTTPPWPEITSFKGTLGEGPDVLEALFDLYFALDRLLSMLFTYAHLRHDEDIANDEHKAVFNRITSLVHTFNEETSWIEPELLALSENQIEDLLTAPALEKYRFHIEKIVRIKTHLLSPDKEELMAQAGKALQTAHKAFSAINDADFIFGKAQDSKGEENELTHGLYQVYLRSQDRKLRENAFKNFHKQYSSYENTLCELLNGQLQAHAFNAKARRYSSCLEAALFPKNIDMDVYHALIQAVRKEIKAHHRYIDLRQKALGLDQIHFWDMYIPLTPQFDIHMPYEEAEDLIIESVKPLGDQYQTILREGLKKHRWVDRYENKNKRSGAYSSGCYDSPPYILMNYKDLLRDVFTLAHEAGHSMHSHLTHVSQPYQYGSYPIFLAEVASTFNEELLMRLLLKRAKTSEERAFLINQKIDDIRGTLFRQTMFAEFELLIHQMAEKNEPITPAVLKQEYRKLNADYFGPSVDLDDGIEIEWARIPHFYYNFYVFQYATGISAALALADRVVSGGRQEQEEYLSFLKAGCSQYPIDILQAAGVDMRSPEPVESAISRFALLVEELDGLLNAGSHTDPKAAEQVKKIKH